MRGLGWREKIRILSPLAKDKHRRRNKKNKEKEMQTKKKEKKKEEDIGKEELLKFVFVKTRRQTICGFDVSDFTLFLFFISF